jgi:hypothetical protein
LVKLRSAYEREGLRFMFTTEGDGVLVRHDRGARNNYRKVKVSAPHVAAATRSAAH